MAKKAKMARASSKAEPSKPEPKTKAPAKEKKMKSASVSKPKGKTKVAGPAALQPLVETKAPAVVIQPEIVEPKDRGPGGEELEDSSLPAIDPDALKAEFEASFPRVLDDSPEENDSRALAPTDPITLYLAEIRKYPLLTKDEERRLALRYRETGDAIAAEKLVTSNLRFVVKVAAEYSRFGAKLIDLIQEGNVGLMHAVREFNPYKGVRLITYAVWWIRGYIQEYLMRQYSMVRIGTTQNQRKLFYRLQKERAALAQLGEEPTYALLAGRLGVSEEEVETMSQRLAGRDVSLSQPIDNSGNSMASRLDFEESEAPPADETIGHLEEMAVLRENLAKIRDSLSEKELYILETRLLADEPLTLQEIGDHFGVTREAVRQLEARLIGKIRAAVTESLETDKT